MQKSKFFLTILVLTLLLFGCTSLMSDLSLQGQIREYLYKYQPTTGPQFVIWANNNLSDYSPHQVYTALHEEGEFQAKLGHPNVVGVLSFATRSWAEQNNLQYNPRKWQTWQEEAIDNLRTTPEKLQLWPED